MNKNKGAQRYEEQNSLISKIIEIVKLEENNIEIKNKDTSYNINYNQEVSIPSNNVIYDGINYSYTIKIVKK